MKQYSQFITYSFLFFVFILLCFTSACTSPRDSNYLQQGKEPHYSVKPFEDYRLQNNDELYLTILTSNDEFADAFNQILTFTDGGGSTATRGNTQGRQNYYTVFENGNVSIPFFGDIRVVGLTIAGAENVIQKKMQESVPDAQVRVVLKNNLFYVVDNQRGGAYGVYKENMTIYQALAVSGDVNASMDLSKVKIVRQTIGGNSIIKTFDLRTESVIESEFYYIKPNDVIYYSTSSRSFFRITSFTSLVTTIIAPITFLIATLSL